jgi:hypothetical protein
MVKRWRAAGMLNPQAGFRRVTGHERTSALVAAPAGYGDTVTLTSDDREAA